MKNSLTLFLLTGLAALTAQADVVYSYEGPFRVTPTNTTFKLPDWPGTGEATYGRVSFDMREYLPQGGIKTGFISWSSKNAANERIMNYTTVAALHLLVYSPSGKTVLGDTSSGSTPYVAIPYGESGDNYGWTHYEIESGAENFVAKVDGTVNYTDRYSYLPFANFSFYTYGGRTFEFRNLKLETLPAPVIRKIEQPTFAKTGEVATATFDVPDAVSAAVGGVMFWAKYVPGTDCVKLLDSNDTVRASFYMCGDYRIQANIKVAGTKDNYVYKRRLFDETTRAVDDVHYAFTWDEYGFVKFFLNGVPYTLGSGGDDAEFPITGNDLDGVTKVAVFSKGKQRVRDLSVYHRTLTNAEVQAVYRARMPVDLAFHDSVLKADESGSLTLTVAPGGTYTKPEPVDGAALVTGRVDVALIAERITPVYNAAGKRIRYDYSEVGRFEKTGVLVTNATDLTMDALTLPRSSYRARVTVTAAGQPSYMRTKLFKALPDVTSPAATTAPGKSAWQKTELLFEKTFDSVDDMPYATGAVHVVESPIGTYLEGGNKGGLTGDRMGMIVEFPTEAKGHPCLLEMDWPDDRDRMIGWCMFLETPSATHRDRLMAGVCAGDRLRTTGRMQTARYLFYPSSTNHLFEVRTQATGWPAAIAALRVYRLAEPLPVLRIHRPEGYPYRRFGHVDEDQTFYFLLNDQYVSGLDGITGALAEYFGYTGQSTFDYTILRYIASMAPSDLYQPYTGYAGSEGELPYVFRQFAALDIAFCGTEGLFGEPHIVHSNRIDGDYKARGYIACNDEGYALSSSFAGDAYPNMAHPDLQTRFFAYCQDFLVRCARAGLKTLRLPVTMLGKYQSADYSYDVWSRAQFTADTGIASPADDDAAWRTWRAQQVTKFFTRFVAWANATVPDMDVRLILPAGGESAYNANGIDVPALARIEGCTFGYERGYTQYWWDLYRSSTTNVSEYAALYDTSLPVYAALRSAGRSAAETACGAAYFETFRDSLVNDRFASYFQSLDVKPWGRNFLREPAHMVASLDTLSFTIGNQPLGTLGNEDETREFVQAYSALPALPFADVPSEAEGVVCRSLVTTNGTYFYLVNTTDDVRSVRLQARTDWPAMLDLSSDATLSTNVIALNTYQLRSFLIPGRRFAILNVTDATETGAGETVTLLRGDEAGESAFTNACAWSDGQLPHDGSRYLVAGGIDEPLRTIEGDSLTNRTDSLPGDALQIGISGGAAGSLWILEHGSPDNAGSAWDHAKDYPKLCVDNLILANGEIRFTSGPYARLQGHATVLPPDPFVIRLAKASNFLESDLTGGDDTSIQFVKGDSGEVESYRIFVSGDNAKFSGQMIFDGVTLSSGEMKDTSLGASTAYRPDALVFRNGAKIRPDFNWTVQPISFSGTSVFKGTNRGMTFESDSGIRPYNKSTLKFQLGVAGDTVNVWGVQDASYGRYAQMMRVILDDRVDVGTFHFILADTAKKNAPDLPRLVFGPQAQLLRTPTVDGIAGGTIGAHGTTVTVKRLLSGDASYFESGFDADETTLGHVVLDAGSSLGAGPIVIRVEGYPRHGGNPWLPILTIPTSVRASLTASDIQLKTMDYGDSPLSCDIVAENDAHVVRVAFTQGLATQRFVAAPGSVDPSTYAPDGAFHSWASATTNLADALNAAVAGDTVYVAKGIHPVRETLVLEKDVTVIGVDPTTMLPDKGAILDGGFPAHTNRMMKIKKAKLHFLTFQNAGTTSAGCYSGWCPGGAALSSMQDSNWRVYDCIFSNCVAVGTTGGALSTWGTFGVDTCERCLFVNCSATIANGGGGAAHHQYDSLKHCFGYKDCTFIGNSADYGGAIFPSTRGLKLTGCTFRNNKARYGGAFYAALTTAHDCVFEGGGTDTGEYSAFYIHDNDGSDLKRIVIRNFDSSGALLGICGQATVDGLVITNNAVNCVMRQFIHTERSGKHITLRNAWIADNDIGGIPFCLGGYAMDFENCTVAHNRMQPDKRYFGIVSNQLAADNVLVDSIFWQNGTTNSHEKLSGGLFTLTVTNSIFDCTCDNPDDRDVRKADPRLNAAGVPMRGSPAIDAGEHRSWMTDDATDALGSPRERPVNHPDLGAIEAPRYRGPLITID